MTDLDEVEREVDGGFLKALEKGRYIFTSVADGTEGLDTTIQITKDATLGQTVNGSATFVNGVLISYVAPS